MIQLHIESLLFLSSRGKRIENNKNSPIHLHTSMVNCQQRYRLLSLERISKLPLFEVDAKEKPQFECMTDDSTENLYVAFAKRNWLWSRKKSFSFESISFNASYNTIELTFCIDGKHRIDKRFAIISWVCLGCSFLNCMHPLFKCIPLKINAIT